MPAVKNQNIAIAAVAITAVALTSRFAWKKMKKRKAADA